MIEFSEHARLEMRCHGCGKPDCALCYFYQNSPAHRWHWDGRVGEQPGSSVNATSENEKPKPSQPAGGVGTELKATLDWFGFKSGKKCRCDERAAEMDRRGVAWCEENQQQVVDWLREGAKELGVLFFEPAAWAAVAFAIRRIRNRESK